MVDYWKGELELVIKRLNKDVGWDGETIKAWLSTPHTAFNFEAPYEMITKGFGYKVLDYVDLITLKLRDNG